jgi:putative DNA primase/helicase
MSAAPYVLDEFRHAMRRRGLIPPERIEADGRIHRCDIDARHGKGDGAYLLRLDGVAAGGFQNWQDGAGWDDWHTEDPGALTPQERAMQAQVIERARREREDEQARRYAEAADRAHRFWRQGVAAEPSHPYLQSKHIRAQGARLYRGDLDIAGVNCDGSLMIPLRDVTGVLQSLEFITEAGDKLFLPGGRTSGCYYSIGKPGGVLVIAEGYATGVSIHEATGYAVACAMSARNMVAIATVLREKFTGIRLVIAADNDIADGKPNAGLQAALEAAGAANGLVAVPELAGRKCDFNDLLMATGGAAVRLAIEAAKAPEQESQRGIVAVEPTPLTREIARPSPYPIDALGPVLGPAARAIAEIVQVPTALAGNSVLAAAALAAQAHTNVQTLGGVRPVSLYVLTIAESGERKTTADRVATAPIRDRVAALLIQYRDALRAHEASLEGHKMRVRQAKEAARTADDLAQALRGLTEEEPPRKPWMIATEPTAEGLLLSLKDGQFSQGLFSDEGGQFVGGHALSDEAELRTIAMLSRAWEGSTLDRVRAKDREHVTLHGRRLSLHLLCQPEVAMRLLGKSLYRSQGFLARFLIAAPYSLIGTRQHDGSTSEVEFDPRVIRYCNAVKTLLDNQPIENESQCGLDPPCLRLSQEAMDLLISAYNEIEAAQSTDGELFTVREFASKAAEHACRLAGVMTLLSNPEAVSVSSEDMTRALQLVQFYIAEQVRLTGAASISPQIASAKKLLDWLKRTNRTHVTPRQIMQSGPNGIRDAASAKSALHTLVEHHWLITQDGRQYMMPRASQAALAGC